VNQVPGLGLVPENWRVERARWLLNRKRRAVRPEDGIVTAFRDGRVTLRSNRRLGGFTEAIHEIGYQGIRKGDLVVHSMDAFAGAIGVSDSDGKSSPVVHAYSPAKEVDPRFLAYSLRILAINGFIETLAKGIRERSTSFDAAALADVRLPAPELEEQRRIADFLDAEVGRIDGILEIRRRGAVLLPERFRSLVDSEFSGLREDSLVQIQSVCTRIIDSAHKTAPISDIETGFRMIRTSNVRNGRVDLENTFSVSEEVFREWNSRGTPQAGDLILTREAPLGQVGILESDENVFLGQRLVLYRPDAKKINRNFLLFCMMSSHVDKQFRRLGAGSLHEHMNIRDALKLRIFCPPLDVQSEISEKILVGRNEITRLQDSIASQIALLEERKRALITAAVTGKIDVTTARGADVS
jgi:type I restriction enzyme S subunit